MAPPVTPPDKPAADAPAERFAGSLFHAYLAGLDALGLRAAVRAEVPPDVQRMMDAPPLHTAWLGGEELGHIFHAVIQLRGLEGMRQLGYEATRGSTGRLLKPILQTTMAMHGRSPAALFTHLGSICRPLFKGLEFSYAPESERSGTLTLRSAYRMNTASFAAWEGSLRILFDECGVPGTIGASAISENGHVGTMKVSW